MKDYIKKIMRLGIEILSSADNITIAGVYTDEWDDFIVFTVWLNDSPKRVLRLAYHYTKKRLYIVTGEDVVIPLSDLVAILDKIKELEKILSEADK